jgi:hypothetical protein
MGLGGCASAESSSSSKILLPSNLNDEKSKSRFISKDVNGDGRVSFPVLWEGEWQTYLMFYDEDKDGIVSKEEYLKSKCDGRAGQLQFRRLGTTMPRPFPDLVPPVTRRGLISQEVRRRGLRMRSRGFR